MKGKSNKTKHDVSLKRPPGWYGADNEMVTVFAPKIGPYAFSVYHLLTQRAFLKEKDRSISQGGIARAMGMSKEAAANALLTLKNYHLVEELPALAPNKPLRYEVVHAKDVLAAQPEFHPQNEGAQFPQEQPEYQLRAKRIRSRNSSRAVDGIPSDTGKDSSHDRAEFQPPNKEEVLKDRRQEQDSTPLPPRGGGNSEVCDEATNETAATDATTRGNTRMAESRTEAEAADQQARPGALGKGHEGSVSAESGDRRNSRADSPAAIGGLDETSNEKAVADDLVRRSSQVLATVAGVTRGFETRVDERANVSGVATLDAANRQCQAPARQGPRLSRDGLTPVAASLSDLYRDLLDKTLPNRVIVNVSDPDRTPRQLAHIFLQELHEQFASAYGISPTVAKGKGSTWEDPHTAWMRCFEHVGVGEIEADGDAWVVVLETRKPRDLADGLTKYAAKVQLAMKKAFGREVQLVPRLEAV